MSTNLHSVDADVNYYPHIYADSHQYFKKNRKGIRRLSNFVMEVIDQFHDDDCGIIRVVRITSKSDQQEALIYLRIMASITRFKVWCLTHGDFFFFGKTQDLYELWPIVFRDSDSGEVTP